MDEAALDPMEPLDFGIDLNQITCVSEHGTLAWAETASPLHPAAAPQLAAPSVLRPPLDFGVVPSEPLRDGMVPAFPGHYSPDLPGATADPPTAPARELGRALFWSFAYNLEAQAFEDAAATAGVSFPEGLGIEAGLGGAPCAVADDGPIEVISLRGPRGRASKPSPLDVRSRAETVARWREKKSRRRAGGGRPGGVLYESRKRTALVKPRINGKFVTLEMYEKHLVGQAKQNEHTVPTAE